VKRQSNANSPPSLELRDGRSCTRQDQRMVRAAGCAAYEIFSNCKKYNPTNQANYLGCVLNLLYSIIRMAAPRKVPVPAELNRSTISDSQRHFLARTHYHLNRLDAQAKWKRRPTQPKIVAQAMSMTPSARSGTGPKKARALLARIPAGLKPIHVFLSNGIEFLLLRKRFQQGKNNKW
jgi:hypothetical protein